MTKNTLWQFIDESGSFRVTNPDAVSRLYFPLANEAGILSSITPDLHGDIKTNHNSFLMIPVTIEDLHNSKSSRNFWLHVEGKGCLSLTGVSAEQQAKKFHHQNRDTASVEAGLLWHKVRRENKEWGLESEILNFVPACDDTVELMVVSVRNTGKSSLKITPTSAIPIFGRSADNLRDHHHVTSLLHRIISHPAGVVVRPTMSFDERGHKVNETLYAVVGTDASGELPVGSFYTVPEFIGEGGSFEAPLSIIKNLPPPKKDGKFYQGKSAIGALRFKTITLAPRQKAEFILILGIADKESKIESWIQKYGSSKKCADAFENLKKHWSASSSTLQFSTPDSYFNGWTRWVTIQPTLRKLFGCSFLPDFDYGRGGRGWRDLWQDCLALLLTTPNETRRLLLHNFNGIRIDGSNATIIGSDGREFIADRNNITRVWMDHGVWPYLTTELYIHQSGDFGILFENAKYFRDRQMSRARRKDASWSEADGRNLKSKKGTVVEATVLEHLLVQHLVQFYNVGEHNHIRLENADWNDGLDMAYERGESVAFTALYGSNLLKIATLLEEACKHLPIKKVSLSKELLILLDRVSGKKVNYSSIDQKQKTLERYFLAVQPALSGAKTDIPVKKLVDDLKQKGEFILSHIRQKEWLQTHAGDAFYNGYYDNHGRRVEGDFPKGLHMTLAGQVFAIMGNVATNDQVKEIFKSAKKYLKDPERGGFRLNTNFHEIRPDLGRAFSFAYGEKENGAFFSHMAVMFASALYQRGFVYEGREVLNSIYQMSVRTEQSGIYPGLPEYFNSEGRGLYHYLTGSASWFILTLLTQTFGIRGKFGDLLLEPKLIKEDFRGGSQVSVVTEFAGKRLQIVYQNPKKMAYEHYHICKVDLNGKELKGLSLNLKHVLIPRDVLLGQAKKPLNQIVVTLE